MILLVSHSRSVICYNGVYTIIMLLVHPLYRAEVKSLLGEFQETVSSSRAAAEQFSEHSLVPVLLSALPGPNIPEPLSLQVIFTGFRIL